MKFQVILLLLGLLAIVSCCCLADDQDQAQQDGQANQASKLLKHKLFDFGRFKGMFKKKYASFTEELARQKIFFANAFRAFLSLVGYKHKKFTMFLKIHDKSDWTNEELRMLESRSVDGQEVSFRPTEVPELADLSSIERELQNVVENRGKNKAYEKIAEELSQIDVKRRRRKRNAGSKRDSISIDDLVDDEVDVKMELGQRVPSNNPHYEPPELDSFGAEDDQQSSSTPPASSWLSKLAAGPKSDIVGSIVNGVVDIFTQLSGFDEDDEDMDEIHEMDVTDQMDQMRVNNEVDRKILRDEIFVDHRKGKCMGPVKNQGQCGSCFIFSTMAALEYQYCKEHDKFASFSEQYVIDCGAKVGIRGCSGGIELDVSRFAARYGVELAMNYPYRMRIDSCPYHRDFDKQKMGYLRVNGHQLKYIDRSKMDEYIKRGPIIVGVGVSDRFHSFGGGIDDGRDCDKKRGHSMLIVGSGRKNGVEYWIMRNSYSKFFGIDGYYQIAKDATECYLDRYTGGVFDPPQGRTIFQKENPFYDYKPVLDHNLQYNSGSEQMTFHINPDMAVSPIIDF